MEGHCRRVLLVPAPECCFSCWCCNSTWQYGYVRCLSGPAQSSHAPRVSSLSVSWPESRGHLPTASCHEHSAPSLMPTVALHLPPCPPTSAATLLHTKALFPEAPSMGTLCVPDLISPSRVLIPEGCLLPSRDCGEL